MTFTTALGHPRLHLRRTDSTNERLRALATAGAPHGTLMSAAEQTAGRGRQGRRWSAPAGSALLMSLLLRQPPALLPLVAAVAVCDAVEQVKPESRTTIKWPNDVVLERMPVAPAVAPPLAKLAGILVEGRPQEQWAVLGIGVNVAVRVEELPEELRERAASLEMPREAVETLLARLLAALERWLGESPPGVLDAWRARDALCGREVSWSGGSGRAMGVDDGGRLVVELGDGARTALEAGEVHLGVGATARPNGPPDC
ncbi:MAG TPA: biotin--[acetyl-CoA-carboxylase] ligase [Solirubrobacteraceae bacterium]|nr:biotin--[acetyl-CoA-carboxylase] ligase [Solirubrobacteraceae bacterium]